MFSEGEKEFLLEHKICRLATVSAGGQPHNVPVGYAFDGNRFYVTTDHGTRKLKNLRQNRMVALLVDIPKKPRRAVMVQGSVDMLESGAEFEEAAGFVAEQRGWRRWREGEQVVLKITPAKKSSWGLED